MPQPPLVTYTRTKNLRDILFRARVPRNQLRGGMRTRPPGFYKCQKRINCVLCQHSTNNMSFLCPVTGKVAKITQHITCQAAGVYILYCTKDTGTCNTVKPIYVGICGIGENSNFTIRMAQHIRSAIQPCQKDTIKPVGCHFKLPGHVAHRDMKMLPIEIVSAEDPFLLRARERYNIVKFNSEKFLPITYIEHRLNLDKGQD